MHVYMPKLNTAWHTWSHVFFFFFFFFGGGGFHEAMVDVCTRIRPRGFPTRAIYGIGGFPTYKRPPTRLKMRLVMFGESHNSKYSTLRKWWWNFINYWNRVYSILKWVISWLAALCLYFQLFHSSVVNEVQYWVKSFGDNWEIIYSAVCNILLFTTQSPEEDWSDHMENHQADSPLYVWPDVWSAD